MKKKSCWQCDK